MSIDQAHHVALPRRVVAKTILLSTAALLAAAALTLQPGAASGWNQGSAEATLWQLMNGARSNNGVAPVQQHGTLVSLARWRSRDMIERDYFSHTILGSGCEVYCYYDQNGLAYLWGGENIGWNSGQTDDYSPVRAHEQFMGSAGHRANVLNASFTHGGVGAWAADNVDFQGYVQNPRMYTELFMQAAGGGPAPPPAGGGGGGGGGAAPGPVAPAAQIAPPEPEAMTIEVAAPARPVSSMGVDGVAQPVTGAADAGNGVEKAWHRAPKGITAVGTTTSMRVEAAGKNESGFLEGVIGTLLGALFG